MAPEWEAPAVVEGSLDARGLRIAVVVARFNELVTERLVEAATATFRRLGGDSRSITIVRVPGAFELPVVASALASSGRFDGVACLGAVIRGGTDHYVHVASQAAAGLARVQLDTGVPVAFGVLTTDTVDQALERSGGKGPSKGEETMCSLVETIGVMRSVGKLGGLG
jgi:6,7-dimethyl-8-ribityllumazine synthase